MYIRPLPARLSTRPRLAPLALISAYSARASCQTAAYKIYKDGQIHNSIAIDRKRDIYI